MKHSFDDADSSLHIEKLRHHFTTRTKWEVNHTPAYKKIKCSTMSFRNSIRNATKKRK